MTRTRMLLALSTLALAGLAGCGVGAGTTPADVSAEAAALQTVGFDTGLAANPTPSATTGAKVKHPRIAIRKYLRKNTLHGSVTVQGKDGVKTIVVQRGSVTAVTSTTVSVKSTDGFTQTWTFGKPLRVVQDKKKVATSALKAGETVGVAGISTAARLIAIS